VKDFPIDFRTILSAATPKEIRLIRRSCATIRKYRQEKIFVLFVQFVFKKSERFSKRFLNDFERSDPKKKFVKFEINSEEFLRVAHPSKHGH